MTDNSTLNGSLETLGTLMATNLTNKGITSSYNEGLTTLANKILNIQSLEYYYDPLTSEKTIWKQLGNSTTITYDSDGMKTVGSTSGCYLQLQVKLPDPCEITTVITAVKNSSNNTQGGMGINNTWFEPHSTNIVISGNGLGTTTIQKTVSQNDVLKIIRNGTTISYYLNDTLLHSLTSPSGDFKEFFIRNVVASGITLKDLTIKAL